MTVKELIEQLQVLDPGMEVIMQGDPEGNFYNKAAGACEVVQDEENVYSLEDSHDDQCLDEDEWDELKNDKSARRCVVWPL